MPRKVAAPKIIQFNPRSSQQLQVVLKGMGVKLSKRTKKDTGFATDEMTLRELTMTPFIETLISHRELSKHIGTYINPVLCKSEASGCIYPQYHQELVETHRLSSSGPNIQNIPKHSDLGKEFRKCIIAREGYKLVSFDYSQLQMRILTHYSQDPELLSIYLNNGDVHTTTANELGISRNPHAKEINFGFSFGMMPPKFKRLMQFKHNITISKPDAETYHMKFFNKYRMLKPMQERLVKFTKERGWAPSLMGFRRPLDLFTYKSIKEKFALEHEAVNTPFQAGESQIVKLAMIKVYKDLGLIPLMQIHDDITFELKDDDKLLETQAKIKGIMESINIMSVPLKAESKIGQNWSEV